MELGGYATELDALNAFQSTITHLRQSIGMNTVLHRAIIVSPTDAERFGAGLCVDAGIYWSECQSVANDWTLGNAYQEEFPALKEGVRLLLSCHVERELIDWVETAACRLGSSYEEEVRLTVGAKVSLTNVEAEWGYNMAEPTPVYPAP
jgi:hypothetical protein